ncbi:MAG: selenium metabolism-associated LysR family transcriptional regulator [Desulfobulbaceae bacterium]|nr:selenium metabolism-associated LysR family transcriptional regulator [Desulfobulbaceae bacterium]HIJ80000.1 LysR family transcriptional regulator [Deltaproteobacteria bacterium]
MDLHRLEVFCKVVELKSFTKAADAVFLSQPTVSEHIRSLEETLGERLVDRLGREMLPTQAGSILYKHAQKILRLKHEAEQAIKSYSGKLSGHLYMGASTIPGTYLLPQIIGGFKKEYPAIQMTLFIGNSRKVADGVLNNDTEFGIVGARWSDPALEWQQIFADELVLTVYPQHPFAKLAAVKPAQLIGEPIIIRERDSGTRKVMTELLQKKLDLSKLSIVAEMGSTEAVRQSIKSEIGIAILSRQAVAEDITNGTLVAVPIKGINLLRPFYLIHRKNRQLSPLSTTFIRRLEEAGGANR